MLFLIQARILLAFLATWAHCWLVFSPLSTNTPRFLFCWTDFLSLFPKPTLLHGVVVTEVQHTALSLVECHVIGWGPLVQAIQIPLQACLPRNRSTLLPMFLSSAILLSVDIKCMYSYTEMHVEKHICKHEYTYEIRESLRLKKTFKSNHQHICIYMYMSIIFL